MSPNNTLVLSTLIPSAFESVEDLRDKLNELTEELDQVKVRLDRLTKQGHVDSTATFKGDNATDPRKDFGPLEPSGNDIRALTTAKEESLLWNQIEAQTAHLPGCDEEVLKLLAGSFTVEITNLLDVDLTEPDYVSNVDNNLTASDFPESIEAGTLIALKASPKLIGANMLLSYKISCLDLRLVISFAHEGHIAVALAPTELAFQRLVYFSFINEDLKMVNQISDRKWIDYSKLFGDIPDDEASIVIRNQNVLVGLKLAYTSSPTVQVKLVSIKGVDIGSCSSPLTLSKFLRNTTPIASGKTGFWKTDGILEHVLETYGVVVEITNFLNVALSRPKSFLIHGQPFLLPKMVNKNSKDVLIAIINHAGVESGGVVSFRIGTTDLVLAIAFQVFNNGNRFAVAFVPVGVPTDRDLLLYLTSNNQWKTSPDQKFGQASEGELVIETRNIRARAAMTNDLKAVMNVAIKTL